MATTSLEFLITARDTASKVFEDVGKKARTTEEKFQGVARGVNVAMAAGAVGLAVLGKQSVDAASNLAESTNAVQVSFGKAAEGVLALSENSATSVGMASADFNTFAVQFASFGQTIAGTGGDVAATIGDISGRAADFASVMNVEVADAARIFQSGLAGETEPLRKYGIDLSAAAVEAYAMNDATINMADGFSEAEKVQARYGSLMEQTAKTAGDFANTSDGLANSQRILAAETENLKADIGEALLPVMQRFTQITRTVVDWVDKHKAATVAIIGVVGALAIALNVAANWTAITTTAAYVAAAAQWLWNAALAANPIGIVIAAIAALVAGLVWFFTKTETGRMAWEVMTTAIVDGWNWLWETVLKPGIDALAATFTWLWENILSPIFTLISLAFETLGAVIGWWWTNITMPILTAVGELFVWLWDNAISPTVDAIGVAWSWLWSNAISPAIERGKVALWAIGGVFTWLNDSAIQPAISKITTAFDTLKAGFEAVKTFFEESETSIADVFTSIGGAIKSAFTGAFNRVADAWNNTVGRLSFTVPDWVPAIGGKGWNVPDIPKFFTGGTMPQSGFASVGEYGQETVYLPGGARVERGGTGGTNGPVELSDRSVQRLASAILEGSRNVSSGLMSATARSTQLAERMA